MHSATLDKIKIRQAFSAAAGSYDQLARLQRQVGESLLVRFPPVGDVDCVLDVGSGTGFLSRRLIQGGVNNVVALDIAFGMLQASRSLNSGAVAYICGDVESLPMAGGVATYIYSNLALQWIDGLERTFAECLRVLRPGGRLVFSTFGTQTLSELKAAWAAVDDYTHVNRFCSGAEISALLKQAGFSVLSLRQQTYCCSYPSVLALMNELKGIGAHNVNEGRKRRPTTKGQLQSMIKHYPANADGSIIATYDVLLIEALV